MQPTTNNQTVQQRTQTVLRHGHRLLWPPLANASLSLYHCTLPSLLCASSSMHRGCGSGKHLTAVFQQHKNICNVPSVQHQQTLLQTSKTQHNVHPANIYASSVQKHLERSVTNCDHLHDKTVPAANSTLQTAKVNQYLLVYNTIKYCASSAQYCYSQTCYNMAVAPSPATCQKNCKWNDTCQSRVRTTTHPQAATSATQHGCSCPPLHASNTARSVSSKEGPEPQHLT